MANEFHNYYSAMNGYASGPNGVPANHDSDVDIEELDITRLREITGKAVSGSLLLLLKWFKRSRKLVASFL